MATDLSSLNGRSFDLVVIGGGINGAGIARDAAGRGLSVLLCEKDDLAAHTSSASTKLIHGGLRYLEYYEFGLVRKALTEREILLRIAPHIIWPLRFVMPYDQGMRPDWMIRIGLFLYDHLAQLRRLTHSRGVHLRHHPAGEALKAGFVRGYEYSDAWVQDSRLVVLNAMDAAERGATIATRCEVLGALRDSEAWSLRLQMGDKEVRVRGKAVVNAAGPWVAQVLKSGLGLQSGKNIRLVKGSHIVVPRLFDHAYAYIFQNPDKRIIFAIPYERDFTLIGTTDLEYRDDLNVVSIDRAEIDYLCAMVGRYFAQPISAQDVVWSYSGVRPLLDEEAHGASGKNASGITRDYALELDTHGAPALSVFGGKITTYRRLAEEVMDKLLPCLMPAAASAAPAWTHLESLPGGDFAELGFESFMLQTAHRYPWLPMLVAYRYARNYGTRMQRLIAAAATASGLSGLDGLGEEVLPALYAAEIDYLRRQEFAQSAMDILWRRTKLGLHLGRDAENILQHWIDSHPL